MWHLHSNMMGSSGAQGQKAESMPSPGRDSRIWEPWEEGKVSAVRLRTYGTRNPGKSALWQYKIHVWTRVLKQITVSVHFRAKNFNDDKALILDPYPDDKPFLGDIGFCASSIG